MTQQGMSRGNHPGDKGRVVEVARLKVERPDPVVALVKNQPQISSGNELPDQGDQHDAPERGAAVNQGIHSLLVNAIHALGGMIT